MWRKPTCPDRNDNNGEYDDSAVAPRFAHDNDDAHRRADDASAD
jgi:hypothetical protein